MKEEITNSNQLEEMPQNEETAAVILEGSLSPNKTSDKNMADNGIYEGKILNGLRDFDDEEKDRIIEASLSKTGLDDHDKIFIELELKKRLMLIKLPGKKMADEAFKLNLIARMIEDILAEREQNKKINKPKPLSPEEINIYFPEVLFLVERNLELHDKIKMDSDGEQFIKEKIIKKLNEIKISEKDKEDNNFVGTLKSKIINEVVDLYNKHAAEKLGEALLGEKEKREEAALAAKNIEPQTEEVKIEEPEEKPEKTNKEKKKLFNFFKKKKKEEIAPEAVQQEPVIEKEKTEEDLILDGKRNEYAEAYKSFDKKKYRKFVGDNILSVPKINSALEEARKYIVAGDAEILKNETEPANLPPDLQERKNAFIAELANARLTEEIALEMYKVETAKTEYDGAKENLAHKLSLENFDKLEKEYGKSYNDLSEEEQNKFNEETKKYENIEIFQKLIIKEADLLQKEKIEKLPPEEKKWFIKTTEWYLGLNKWKRLAASSVALGVTGAVYGGLYSASVFGSAVASRLVRGGAGIGMGQLAGKFVDKKLSKKIEKKHSGLVENLKSEFSLEAIKDIENKYSLLLKKKAKNEREKLYLKSFVMFLAGAGTSAGLGFLEHAYAGGGGGLVHRETADGGAKTNLSSSENLKEQGVLLDGAIDENLKNKVDEIFSRLRSTNPEEGKLPFILHEDGRITRMGYNGNFKLEENGDLLYKDMDGYKTDILKSGSTKWEPVSADKVDIKISEEKLLNLMEKISNEDFNEAKRVLVKSLSPKGAIKLINNTIKIEGIDGDFEIIENKNILWKDNNKWIIIDNKTGKLQDVLPADKQSMPAAQASAETVSAAETAQVAQEAAGQNIIAEIEIKGKINTLSEAVEKALKQEGVSDETKDNFIKHWLGDKEEISAENRDELLNKAIRKLSVANIELGDGDDVQNLLHEGEIVQVNSDGTIQEIKGARIVSEDQLRQNAELVKGVKSPAEVEADISNEGFVKEADALSEKQETEEMEKLNQTEQTAETITPNTIKTPEEISFKINKHPSLKEYDMDGDSFLNENEILEANKKIDQELNLPKYKHVIDHIENTWMSDDTGQNHMVAQHPGEIDSIKNLKAQRDLLAEPLVKIKAAEINAAEAPEAKITLAEEVAPKTSAKIIPEKSLGQLSAEASSIENAAMNGKPEYFTGFNLGNVIENKPNLEKGIIEISYPDNNNIDKLIIDFNKKHFIIGNHKELREFSWKYKQGIDSMEKIKNYIHEELEKRLIE